jgi:hypothetical protein
MKHDEAAAINTNNSLDIFAKHQQRIREQYPDGNVPENVRNFKGAGMAQGALGGPWEEGQEWQ